MFRILHISDVHIGKTYKKSEDIAYKIISDIAMNGLCNLKSVIVTGDIFDGRVGVNEKFDIDNNLIDEAVRFFYILRDEINKRQEYKICNDDFLFAPGNHDLIRTDDKDIIWSKYRLFLQRFYTTIPNQIDQEYFSVIKDYSKEKIIFVGLNSCQLVKKDGAFLDVGYISEAQITEIERDVKKYDGCNVIAFFHHHFFRLPDLTKEIGDTSVISNYSDLAQHLKNMNVKTVLHGHKHYDLERPYITDDYFNSTNSIIYVFSGGSVGTDEKDRHTYSIIDFFEKHNDIQLTHQKFVYNGSLLQPLDKKQIPPQDSSIRIIKLIDLLKSLNYDAYNTYIETVDKLFDILKNECDIIIKWTSEAMTGFNDVYKLIENDYRNILFILYAIHYRTLSYKTFIENKTYESKLSILNHFFEIITKDSSFECDDFQSLFTIKNLKDLTKRGDSIINKCKSKKTQEYLAFTMLGIFFTDLYLVFTQYADDFKKTIEHKININIQDNRFHENVPVSRIVIESDYDRRSIIIKLLCKDATAHKMAVLLTKEFDMLLNSFEDYFKIIGLKLYYILPNVEKDDYNTLDNYNFEAYVPKLIPLLTGKNIYSTELSFARELIQNAIDAIAVREKTDEVQFSTDVIIELGLDSQRNKKYFSIKDNGIGMDRYKIERYFTSIGRSFYSDNEYLDMELDYKPISSFGIGFLSSFMVCREIEVRTKKSIEDSEGLKLNIPNYEGCFFVERDDNITIGTEIILFLENKIEEKKIAEYIGKVMLDVKYNILINTKKDSLFIPSHNIRLKNQEKSMKFFVPINENAEIPNIAFEDIANNNYIKNFEYGLLITENDASDHNGSQFAILNAGILIEQCSLKSLFKRDFYSNRKFHNDNIFSNVILNLPSNLIEINVSREKATGFTRLVDVDIFSEKIAEALYEQILSYMALSKVIENKLNIVYLQEVIEFAIDLCSKNRGSIYKALQSIKYSLNINVTDNYISFNIGHRGDEKKNFGVTVSLDNEELQKLYNWISGSILSSLDEREYTSSTINRIFSSTMDNKFLKANDMDRWVQRLRYSFHRVGIDLKYDDKSIFNIISFVLLGILNNNSKEKKYLRELSTFIFQIEQSMLHMTDISTVENHGFCMKINYSDLITYFINQKRNGLLNSTAEN